MMSTERDDLRERLAERLDELDDDALRWLDDLLEEDSLGLVSVDGEEDEPKLLTRRQLLTGLVAGSAVLGGTNVATALYAREAGEMAGQQRAASAAHTQTVAEVSRTRDEMQAEIDALRGLVAHYEALESVGLEGTVAQSMARFETAVAGLDGVSQLLVDGIDIVRSGLARFEASVPAIREGIAYVDGVLDAIEQRIDAVQEDDLFNSIERGLETLREELADLRERLTEFIERAAVISAPLSQYFDRTLDRIPFDLGDRIQSLVLRVRQVLEAVPLTVAAVRDNLLDPLRTTWFDDATEDDVQAGLLTPVRTQVLDPAEQLLSDLDDIAATWQQEVAAPVQQALAEREARRESLAEYKRRHGLS